MKAVFILVSWISILGGVSAILLGLFVAWDLGSVFAGSMGLLNGYAWGLVGDMWDRLEKAERKLSRVKQTVSLE